MDERCPLCGGSGVVDGVIVGDVADVLSHPGSPPPHVLYEQTGGGERYRRAMIKHGYVIVDADMRCGAPNGVHSCLLKKGHDGPHVHTLGEWTS